MDNNTAKILQPVLELHKMAEKMYRWQKDLDAWNDWKYDPTEDKLVVLYNQVKPIIMPEINKWTSINLPKPLLEARAFKYFDEAINTYDPNKGTRLGTHVRNKMQQLNRYGATYAGITKIPENRIFKIKEYQDAVEEVRATGIEPDAQTIADKLSWKVKEVNRMQQELRTDIISSGSVYQGSVSRFGNSELGAANIYHDLTPKQKRVYDLTMGTRGKPEMSVKDIAATIGVSSAAVTKLRKSIAKKMEKALYYTQG